MNEIVKSDNDRGLIPFKEVEDKIVIVRGQEVLLDRDVATLYGLETKRINEAVRNNPSKFCRVDYMFELTDEETSVLRSKISTLENKAHICHSWDIVETLQAGYRQHKPSSFPTNS